MSDEGAAIENREAKDQILVALNAILRAMAVTYEMPESVKNSRDYEELARIKDALKKIYFDGKDITLIHRVKPLVRKTLRKSCR